jgi:steroid delta-isomerase-like uncharacterized protein
MISEADVKGFVERWSEAWNSHDADQVLDACTDGIVIHDPAWPAALEGKSEVRTFLLDTWTAIPDLTFEAVGSPYLALDKGSASGRWRATGTMSGPVRRPGFAPTGQRIEFEGIDEYELRAGMAHRVTTTYDLLGFARQIGAAPAPGTFAERAGVMMQRLYARRMRRSRR